MRKGAGRVRRRVERVEREGWGSGGEIRRIVVMLRKGGRRERRGGRRAQP